MSAVSRDEADEFILDRYRSIVETIGKRLRVQESDALDVAHDVVAAIYDSLDSYDPEKGPFEAWVAGIVRNHIRRWMEGRGRKVPEKTPTKESDLAPVDGLVLEEIRGYLFDSLQRQPSIYRDALKLRYIDGLGLSQIAKKLGVPLGTVKARLSRAPDMLKDRLQIQQTTIRFVMEKRPRKTE